jgi:hypothetical protein
MHMGRSRLRRGRPGAGAGARRAQALAPRAARTSLRVHRLANADPTLQLTGWRTREEQDLAAGAVMCSAVAEGDGGASPLEGDMVGAPTRACDVQRCGPPALASAPERRRLRRARGCRGSRGLVSPAAPRSSFSRPAHHAHPPPRQVYVHASVRSAETNALLHSTRREEGGGGFPVAFLLGKGRRAPRSWELALLGARAFARTPKPVPRCAASRDGGGVGPCGGACHKAARRAAIENPASPCLAAAPIKPRRPS